MSDLQKYKNKRMEEDPEFWQNYNERFETFKLGVLLKQACVESSRPASSMRTTRPQHVFY